MTDRKETAVINKRTLPQEDYNPDEALKLDHQLCFPLYAAARKVTGLYTPWLKPLGITYTQYLVFLVLWEKNDIPVSQICQRLMLDSGTITPLLKKMEQQGYISRQRDRKDERKVIVSLTQAGKSLKEKAAQIPLQVGSCLPIKPEQAKTLYGILYQILGCDPQAE